MTLFALLGADAGTDLALFSEIGLVISLVVFALIVLRTFSRRHRADHEEASQLPLQDELTERRASGANDGAGTNAHAGRNSTAPGGTR